MPHSHSHVPLPLVRPICANTNFPCKTLGQKRVLINNIVYSVGEASVGRSEASAIDLLFNILIRKEVEKVW